MREGVGDDGSSGRLLQSVVAHLRGGVDGLLQIAVLERLSAFVLVIGPDARQIVGLKL